MIKKNWLTFLFLFILILITYGNSLNNVFLSDDIAEIVQNPNVDNLSYAVTTHPFGFIRLILYWLAFNIGGLNPLIFRLINIFFHTGSVFLVFLIFNRLFSKRLAIFAAAIFAVHPAISEAVVWISGGSYPQYTFFFLLSFFLYILSPKRKLLYILSLISYILSFMSHPQMSLALFLIFPLFEFSLNQSGGGLKKNWSKIFPFFFISIFFLVITISSLPEREHTLQTTHYQKGGTDNLTATLPISITSYFELTFFPKTLTLYHSELVFGRIEFFIRLLVTLAFFGLIAVSYKKNRHIFFCLSFFLIALAPTLTPFKLNWLVAERYLYLPIISLLAVVGFGFDKLTNSVKLRQTGYILFAVIIILLSFRTIVRNIDWKNEDNLWIATGKTSPSSPNTHNNLGDVYGRQGDKLRSLQEFQRAIELKPNYGDAYHNLANVYMELGQPDKALENYQNAIKYNPNLWQSYQNTAAIYFNFKKYDLAIQNLQKAITVNPQNPNLRLALGVVYLNAGDKVKAKELFNLILSVDPTNQTATQGLSEASK